MLGKAIEIAAKAHTGQVDKGGNPYILHPRRVMMNFCESESEAVTKEKPQNRRMYKYEQHNNQAAHAGACRRLL